MTDRPLKRLIVVTAATVILGACNTSDDPSKGGFISGVQGLSSGSYEKRAKAKQDKLQQEEARRRQLQEQKRQTEEDQTAHTEARRAAEQQLEQLDASIAQLDRALLEARAAERADATTLNQLQSELDDLRLQRELVENDPTTQDAEKVKRLQALTQRKQRLEEALAEALAK